MVLSPWWRMQLRRRAMCAVSMLSTTSRASLCALRVWRRLAASYSGSLNMSTPSCKVLVVGVIIGHAADLQNHEGCILGAMAPPKYDIADGTYCMQKSSDWGGVRTPWQHQGEFSYVRTPPYMKGPHTYVSLFSDGKMHIQCIEYPEIYVYVF